MKRRYLALGSLPLLYALTCAAAYVGESWLVYQPKRGITRTPADAGMAFEDVALETSDGFTLHAWFVPAEPPVATVLFAHGTRGNLSTNVDRIRVMHDAGLSVLAFDYRGYGASEGATGDLSEEATYRDGEAAWQWLVTEKKLAPEDVVVWGRSLGGGIASWLAAKHAPRALVLESTYTSLVDVAASEAFFLPVHRLARMRYPTKERLAALDCAVVVAHAADDHRIPFAHAQENLSVAGERAKLVELAADTAASRVRREPPSESPDSSPRQEAPKSVRGRLCDAGLLPPDGGRRRRARRPFTGPLERVGHLLEGYRRGCTFPCSSNASSGSQPCA